MISIKNVYLAELKPTRQGPARAAATYRNVLFEYCPDGNFLLMEKAANAGSDSENEHLLLM